MRLREILQAELDGISRPTSADYDSPSWSHLQAHNNGRIQQINRVLDLLAPIK